MRVEKVRWSQLLIVGAVGVAFLVLNRPAQSAEAQRSWKAPQEARTEKNPVSITSSSIAQGKSLYFQYCVDCHGAKGRGDGSLAGSLSRKPADLTSASASTLTEGEIFWRISNGDDVMPSFEKTFPLSQEERWQLVNFLRTLGKK